jgi:hypothetical protein
LHSNAPLISRTVLLRSRCLINRYVAGPFFQSTGRGDGAAQGLQDVQREGGAEAHRVHGQQARDPHQGLHQCGQLQGWIIMGLCHEIPGL